jgi:hypothetical protein
VSDKLQKAFLLMMRSTIPGETMAARDAVLRLAERDAFALAIALVDGIVASREKPAARDMAQRCWAMHLNGALLSEKERKFVSDMLTWGKPSEKQLDWLSKIYDRMRRTYDGNGGA